MPVLQNEIDIYRLNRIKKHTPEHIIQSGLGIDFQVTGIIDHQTNVDFGGTIDKKLLEDYTFVRALCGLKTRRGEEITVKTEDKTYNLKGSKPILKKAPSPPWTINDTKEGKKEVHIMGSNIEQVQKYFEHFSKSLGFTPESLPSEKGTFSKVSQYIDPMQIKMCLGGPIHLRAIAKSCFNALSFYLTPERVISNEFSDIRNYILDGVTNFAVLNTQSDQGSPPLAHFDERNELFKPVSDLANTLLEHRLIIRGVRDTNIIYATLELFGQIPYSILLCDKWHGDDFCWGIHGVPCEKGKTYATNNFPLSLRPSLSRTDILEHKLSVNNLKRQFQDLIGILCARIEEEFRSNMVSEAVKDVLEPHEGEIFSPELAKKLAQRLAEDYIRSRYRIDKTTPLPSQDLNEHE